MSTQNFEELVNLYHNINVYCAIAALVFLVIAIVLFFQMKIPRIFGELTGRTAQKAIDEMMAENASSGSLTSMKIDEDGRRHRKGRTGALPTGRLRKNTERTGSLNQTNPSGSLRTDSLGQMQGGNAVMSGQQNSLEQNHVQSAETMDNFGSQPTDVLDSYGSQPTDVLDSYGSQPTDVLNGYGSQMAGQRVDAMSNSGRNADGPVYQEPKSETMVLNQNLMTGNKVFVIERSIVEIHTDEVI